MIQQRDQAITQFDTGFLRPLIQTALHFQHLPGLIFIGEISQLRPEGQTIICDFQSIRFISFYFAEGVIAEIVDEDGIDNADEEPCLSQCMGYGAPVHPGMLHDDPDITGSYKIESMRTGKIIEWFPSHVKVRVYNERTGLKEDIVVPKDTIAIIENPLYAVINEPNSTMQRLIRKLNLLDVVDEQSSSGKLDLIIQLPYVIKTEARRQQAEKRRVEIERQLAGSKYGIAYTDGTERITQLNRSVENNLMKQIEYLTSMLYSQLGITQSILDGSADEKTMLNYYNRTIEPIIAAIVDELKRKFLTKTARSQKQSILFFRDPFKLVPVADLSEIADKFTRNEIMTSNEIRQIIGMKPSDDPKADELKNSNISEAKSEPSNGSYDVEPNESDAGAA